MKLFNPPSTKRVLSALGVAALTGLGVAQAQYTGIGTTAPSATLHVKFPTVAGIQQDTTLQPTWNPLIVEHLSRTQNEAAYNAVMAINPSSGIVRYRNVEDLVQNSAEWVYNAGGDHIEPRRYATAMNVDATSVTIGVATTLNGTLTANDAATFNSTLTVTGTASVDDITFGNTQTETATADNNYDLVMVQNAAGVVRNIGVDDLLAESGEWIYVDVTGDGLTPDDYIEPRRYSGSMDINGSAANIGVPTDIDNTLDVTGATTLDATLTVTGATTLNGATQYAGGADNLDIDGLTTETNPRAAGYDLVLIQNATGTVRNIDVADLLEESGEWIYQDQGTASLADDFIEPRRYAGGIEVGPALVDIGFATRVDNTLNVTGNTDLDGTLNVDGAATLQTTLLVNGDATFDDALTVNATGGPDHVTLGGLSGVTDVVQTGSSGSAPDVYERVLITDHQGVVRYINADDLVSSASEWVFDDADSDGVFDATEKVYVRRLGNDGLGSDDVFVDGLGNIVVSTTKAYQFGSLANQITSDGTTMAATSAGGYSFAGAADGDFSFTEGGATWMHYEATVAGEQGRVGINTNNPQATLHVEGNIVASNSTVSSDRRFKRNITKVNNALGAIASLRGVSYEFRHEEFPGENFDEAEHLGFIAQEIREVLPQTVFEREDGFLTVDYGAVTPVLVEAVKELNAKVDALQAENAALRTGAGERVGAVSTKQLSELEARIADLTSRLDEVAGRK